MQSRGNGRKTRRNARRRSALSVALLILCPPVGLVLMWRNEWSNAVKYALTAAVAAALVIGVSLLPSAENRVSGGVELIGSKRDVEVYGPALPTAMVEGYTVESSVSVFVDDAEDTREFVYALKDSDYYHDYDCKYAYASAEKMTTYEAYYLGFKPCGLCNPPTYEPQQ